eukprot:5542227-Lingulodinium_polyedra.AAC.1
MVVASSAHPMLQNLALQPPQIATTGVHTQHQQQIKTHNADDTNERAAETPPNAVHDERAPHATLNASQ